MSTTKPPTRKPPRKARERVLINETAYMYAVVHRDGMLAMGATDNQAIFFTSSRAHEYRALLNKNGFLTRVVRVRVTIESASVKKRKYVKAEGTDK